MSGYGDLAAFVAGLSAGAQFVPRWDAGYEAARQVYNGAATARPLFIVYCATEGDVAACVQFAERTGLPFAARAGGHSLQGFCLADGGLVIDVSRISYVRIDAEHATATIGAGVRSLQLAKSLLPFGLHFPGSGDGGVGITGLTLGGGFGPTSRLFGLACDNLLELTLIDANGALITASADCHPDLYWASRGGGGGNFGVVVSMTLRLHPLPPVYLANVIWPAEQAAEVLLCWQNVYSTAPQTRLGLYGGLNKVYGASGKVQSIVGMSAVYAGPENEARAALAPLMAIGSPTMTLSRMTDYVGVLGNLFAYSMPKGGFGGGGPAPVMAQKVKSAYALRPWTQQEFQRLVDGYVAYPKIAFVSLENYGGVVNQVAADAMAFPHRSAAFLVQIGSIWLQEQDRAAAETWVRGYFDTVQPALSDGVYVNYPDLDLKDYRAAYYGNNLPKLRTVKQSWDPDNRFSFPQSV